METLLVALFVKALLENFKFSAQDTRYISAY